MLFQICIMPSGFYWEKIVMIFFFIFFFWVYSDFVGRTKAWAWTPPLFLVLSHNQRQLLSRAEFQQWLFHTTTTATTMAVVPPPPNPSTTVISPPDDMNHSDISLSLRFLPKSGCWALPTTLTRMIPANDRDNEDEDDDKEEEMSLIYGAIVDTGSPFLTVPLSQAVRDVTMPSTIFSTTNEQYGASLGDMEWRHIDLVTWIGMEHHTTWNREMVSILESVNVIVGMVSEEVLQNVGGIFIGLMYQDDVHPTFFEQLPTKYQSFQLNFGKQPTLRLSTKSLISPYPTEYIPKDRIYDSYIMKLVNMSHYGPNLYHYAVNCQSFSLHFRNKNTTIPTMTKTIQCHHSLQRSVVVVLDTGLTGCIFSSSLHDELLSLGLIPSSTLTTATTTTTTTTDDALSLEGLSLVLPTIGDNNDSLTLSSNNLTTSYWQLTCVDLPWFPSTSSTLSSYKNPYDPYPHVIAIGATIWANGQVQRLTIDFQNQLAQIDIFPMEAI